MGVARLRQVIFEGRRSAVLVGSGMEPNEMLAEVYREYFRVYPEVDGDSARLARVYRLRYQVYCIENAYEDAAEFPDGLESDRFDEHALHSLLVHRATDADAGTVRMVFPDRRASEPQLPLDSLCADPALRDDALIPRASTAEVSRFAVSRRFCRRRDSRWSAARPEYSGTGDESEPGKTEHRRLIPHLCLGLIEALVVNSARHGVTHWCAAMEPSLLRMLRALGIHFHPLGPRVQYRGVRQPCYTEVDQMLRRTHQQRRDIWELITNCGAYWPEP